MNLRTYRARTMGDCLAEVKKDLGKDAVILHTRTYKVGGVLGLGAKPMVEVTASDGASQPPRKKSGNIAALRAYTAAAGSPDGVKADVDRAARNAAARNESSVTLAVTPELVPECDPPVVVTIPQRLPVVRTGPVPEPAPRTDSTVRETPLPEVRLREQAVRDEPLRARTEADSGLGGEIATLKRMMGQVLQCSRQTAVRVARDSGSGFAPSALPDSLFQHYLCLLDSDLLPEIADDVIARVREEVPANRLDEEDVVRPAVIRALGRLLPVETGPAGAPTDGRPLTLALVGPTGVGKTTTIAKLAATFKLRQGKRVGLITSDTYRIAAVDQLRTYAEIIGLPLKVAMSPADMASSCQSLDDCDVILVDTAGRSPRDAGRLDELRQYIDAAQPHHTHLVLSSVSSQAVLLEAAGRFLPIKPDRVIFTKIDEAVTHGVLFSVARRINLPLSYITTGQEVPDHIEPGSSQRLAELLLERKGVLK